MKVSTKAVCIVCILEDIYGGTDTISLSEDKKEEILRETITMLNNKFETKNVPSTYITEAHRILKKISHKEDPFKKQKLICNDVGLKVAELVDAELKTKHEEFERFYFLAKWAITGNLIDIRTAGTSYTLTGSDLYNQLLKTFKEKLAVDELKSIFKLVKNSKKILYILDNVGEIALDQLFIRELKRYGNYVVVAARGGPLTSDATVDDLSYIGLDKIANKIITTGSDTLGLILAEASQDFLHEMEEADIIIGKGQANFYTLSTYRSNFPREVVTLFRTKCDCISSLFGKKGKIGIATIIKNEK